MKILFFSPYAFINVWAYPEVVLSEAFRKRGHEVVHVRCKGVYSDFCISMASVNLTPRSSREERQDVCARCNARREIIEQNFGFKTVYLEDYLNATVLSEVEADLQTLDGSNWTSISHAGIPVARYASYEYVLNEKINKAEFSPEQWQGYVTHVKNALITAKIGGALLDNVKPDAMLVYNTLYGCNHVMASLADQRGIARYTEHLGRHHRQLFSEMTIFRHPIDAATIAKSGAWEALRERPITRSQIDKVSEHVSELMEATSPWVYSIKADNRPSDLLRAFFGISQKQRVLLATMASADERFAADLVGALPEYREPIFATQLEWLQALFSWLKDRPDLFLIVRVHPREFPNKREQVTSVQSKKLREVLVDLPSNCRVNWPEDAVSLHDLAKIVDVALNATSTAGLELLLFGIPVVIYDAAQLFSYPSELNFVATSTETYWSSIEAALAKGRSVANVVGAFRWLAFLSTAVAIDIGDVYGRHFANRPPSDDKADRGLLSRLKRRFFDDERSRARNAIPYFDDHFLNVDGLSSINNARWLTYAVERGQSSHVAALSEEVARLPPPDPEIERSTIVAAAKAYLSRVGISADFCDRPLPGQHHHHAVQPPSTQRF